MKRPPTYVIIAAGIVAFALAAYGSHELVLRLRAEPEAAQPRWLEQHIGRAIAFDAPFALHAEALELPDAVKPVVESSSYLAGEAAGTTLAATAIVYREGTPVKLDGAADGALANMRNVPGIVAFEPSKREATLLGKPAIDVEAHVRRDKAGPLHVHGVVFADGRELFIVMLAADDQPATDATWQRLRASIHAVH